jgi:hypothetical protein
MGAYRQLVFLWRDRWRFLGAALVLFALRYNKQLMKETRDTLQR